MGALAGLSRANIVIPLVGLMEIDRARKKADSQSHLYCCSGDLVKDQDALRAAPARLDRKLSETTAALYPLTSRRGIEASSAGSFWGDFFFNC